MTLNSGRLFTENRHLVTISSNFCEDPNDYQNQLNKARQDLIICPNLSQRRNTKQIILTSIATKNKNIRERHLTIDKRETKQKKSIFDTGEKDNKHTKLSCNEKFKKNANYIMDLYSLCFLVIYKQRGVLPLLIFLLISFNFSFLSHSLLRYVYVLMLILVMVSLCSFGLILYQPFLSF